MLLEDMEKLIDEGPDDAFMEREAIDRLIAEVRRHWQEQKEAGAPVQK